jgi:hypothetical protein
MSLSLNQPVLFVRPDAPEEIHTATLTALPDANDSTYSVRLPDGACYRAALGDLAVDWAAARARQQTYLLARAEYFERKAALLRGLAA